VASELCALIFVNNVFSYFVCFMIPWNVPWTVGLSVTTVLCSVFMALDDLSVVSVVRH